MIVRKRASVIKGKPIMFTRLDPPIPLHVIDKGSGQAFGVIDYGAEHHLIWVTALDDGGEIWCASNPQVRMQANWTMGRSKKRPPVPSIKAVGDL